MFAYSLDIIDLKNDNHQSNQQNIKLNSDDQNFSVKHMIYNLENQLILHNETTIWTYSAHDKSWVCEKIEKIPKDYKLIGVSRNGKWYLSLDNYIYERSDEKIPAKRIFADQNNDVMYLNNDLFKSTV